MHRHHRLAATSHQQTPLSVRDADRGRGPAAARPVRSGAGRAGQRLQLGHLHRRDHARGLHRGDRHRGPLRSVREQRGGVREAARGQSGLRRDLPVERVRRAHDRRRHAGAARPRQNPEHGQRRPGVRRSGVRSRPEVQHAVFLGHARSRLPRLGSEPQEPSPIWSRAMLMPAASRCSTRSTPSARRSSISATRSTARIRARSRRPPTP